MLAQVRHGASPDGAKLQALLRSCRPAAVDDQRVVIATGYAFHRKRLEDDDTRQIVEQALAKMIGEPVVLQVVLAEKEPALGSLKEPALSLPKGQEKRVGTGLLASLPPELADDPLIRVAVQELGAVVMPF